MTESSAPALPAPGEARVIVNAPVGQAREIGTAAPQTEIYDDELFDAVRVRISRVPKALKGITPLPLDAQDESVTA